MQEGKYEKKTFRGEMSGNGLTGKKQTTIPKAEM
jgi:hypothetical protein